MEQTIPAALSRAAKEYGDREALAGPAARWTYAELHERVRTLARGYAALGLRPGDRIAIWAPNFPSWVPSALATLYLGATLVPINTRFTGPEADDIIERSAAKALIVSGPFLGVDRLATLTKPPAIVVNLDEEPAELAPLEQVERWAAGVRSDDISDILYTSGTTGRSKGAMSAQRQALAVARAWAECAGLSKDDRYLVVNPFFHSFGYKAGILACLVTGATLVPQAVFDVAESMRLIETERVTVFPGPPTIYQSMLDAPEKHDLSSLRLAVTGAANVPSILVERMRTDLGFDTVLTAYGLTEAVVATMCRPGDDLETIATTSGRATAGFEVRLGEHDEILLRGPNVMLGYLDDPSATAKAIDEEGWLHTGDVGQLDERGYLRITDRLKDMYICGGFNVYPAEVEQALARLDGVAESVVIGVPDHRLGEVGKAFVVPRPGHTLTAEAVIEHCKQRLANYKVPRRVEFRVDLPRNASGKPLKRILREERQ